MTGSDMGKFETLYTSAGKHPLRGPNDIVFDQQGGFWHLPDTHAQRIGLFPDEDVLYVPETFTGRVWALTSAPPGQLRKKPCPSPNGGTVLAGLARLRTAVQHQKQTAVNDRGFEVDIIRRAARDGDPHSLRMSPHDEDLWAVQIPSGDKILGAARFSQATDFSGS